MVEYKCWAFLTLVVKCKCRAFWHGGLVPRMAKCKCWAFLQSLVDQMQVLGLSDRVVGFVTTWSDVSAGCCLSDMIIGLVPT